jgi:hypothetical protein
MVIEGRKVSYLNNKINLDARMSLNYKRVRSLRGTKFVSLQSSLDVEGKKSFSRRNRWRFSRKAKGVIVFAIIAVMLISVFAFLPKQSASNIVPQNTDNPISSTSANTTQSNDGARFDIPLTEPEIINIIGSAQTIRTDWMAVATVAWQYFQNSIEGVNYNTGLPHAGGYYCPQFTDWDLGGYIQAVIDAQKIGLINTYGDWGSYARLDKVLTFLETRELNSATQYPYQFYFSTDSHAESDGATATVDIVDTGRLFVALNNLKVYNRSWTQRIDNFVYNVYGNRSDYAALVPSLKSDFATSNGIYAYYICSGFASFWPNELGSVPDTILSNIVNSPTVMTNNVALPQATISCDPLLRSVFDLNNNSSKLLSLANQVYLAHEAYYNATGKYVAFSEGGGPSSFIWEWVVLPNGDTWKITNGGSSYLEIEPIIYNKVAFSFLALYNTTFARNMVVYLESNFPGTGTTGYSEGGSDSAGSIGASSNTNSLILAAALYAIQNNP